MRQQTHSIKAIAAAVAFGLIFFGLGCSNGGDPGSDSGHGHFHEAPHGGSLVMLGNHAAQLELVPGGDDDWILYVLDGGAERFMRIEQESIRLTLDGKEASFQAVANEATGESVGDTAQFAVKIAGLDPEGTFSVQIDEIEVHGQTFSGIVFEYPEGRH